jgi:hypothetical protein
MWCSYSVKYCDVSVNLSSHSAIPQLDTGKTHDIRQRDARVLACSQEFLPGCRQERAEGEYEDGAKGK